MPIKKPYLNHLRNNIDLITSHIATRSGFLEMALERNQKANPIIEQAKILRAAVISTSNPTELLNIESIKDPLLTAAGFSDKAKKYVLPEEISGVISEFIDKFLVPAGSSYVDELVYRFLLTRGDSIGGSLRNLAGKLAMRKVSRSIISAFTLYDIPFFVKIGKSDWVAGEDLVSNEENIVGFNWKRNSNNRTLLYNLNIASVGNNIDVCLVNCSRENYVEAISRSPELFIALGEIKGGIDPAGADEHWKTARTAFSRIRQSFSNLERFPFTFFIGAAIESTMSQEIWGQLESNVLSNAANLTDSNQLASVINWLVSL